MDDDTTHINQNDDRSSDSSCHISSNTSDWTLSSNIDMTCSTPLYASSPLPVRQSCIELLKLIRQLNLSKKMLNICSIASEDCCLPEINYLELYRAF